MFYVPPQSFKSLWAIEEPTDVHSFIPNVHSLIPSAPRSLPNYSMQVKADAPVVIIAPW